MKLVTAEYKSNASSAEALKAKQEVLRKTYDEKKEKGRGNGKSPCKVQRGYRREQRGE